MRYFLIEPYEERGKFGATIEERTRGYHGSMPETRFSLVLSIYPEHATEQAARKVAEKELVAYLKRDAEHQEYTILPKRTLL